MRIAVKRLAKVEVRPKASNQHEFNATLLRRTLGFPTGKVQGRITFFFYTADDAPPIIEPCDFTLYDARAAHGSRTEFRLYYYTRSLAEYAEEGDLLVMLREADETSLQALVIRAGTRLEVAVQQAILSGNPSSLARFTAVTPPPADFTTATQFARALVTAGEWRRDIVTSSQVFHRVAKGTEIPRSAVMRELSHELLAELGAHCDDPDESLTRGLDAESELYFALEERLVSPRLARIIAEGGDNISRLLSETLSIQQSRKARRGLSLQNHFAYLLERHGVPFTPQCRTEGSETPDFVVPGCDAYHDPGVPDGELAMVACKSTVRERWGQILKEASRISNKFVLTLDARLTPPLVAEMRKSGLEIFMPARLIERHYGTWDVALRPLSVATLLQRLAKNGAARA